MRRYTVILTREENSYLVNVPAFPNIHTYGDSVDEALANAREAIELYLSVLQDEGEPIPPDVEAPMVASVEVAA